MEDLVSIQKRAARIKLLLMDCDGVLTDGRIWILENGDDQKCFSTRDGLGLELLHRAGLKSGIISGRSSKALELRANALGISYLRQGISNKVAVLEQILSESQLTGADVAFIGDDLTDIPVFQHSELSIAVADAAPEVIARANYVTQAGGGHGAVRESIELILKSQGRWNDLVDEYLNGA